MHIYQRINNDILLQYQILKHCQPIAPSFQFTRKKTIQNTKTLPNLKINKHCHPQINFDILNQQRESVNS